MDRDIRLVIFLQWLRFGETFKPLGKSFSLDPAVVQAAISDLWNPLEKVLSNTLPPKSRQVMFRQQNLTITVMRWVH